MLVIKGEINFSTLKAVVSNKRRIMIFKSYIFYLKLFLDSSKVENFKSRFHKPFKHTFSINKNTDCIDFGLFFGGCMEVQD